MEPGNKLRGARLRNLGWGLRPSTPGGGKDRGGKDRGGKDRGGKDRSGRDRGGKDRGENRDRGGDNRREPRAESPKPPAPAPAPAPAAKPRSLYGGRVRKLAPGERPKGGGDE